MKTAWYFVIAIIIVPVLAFVSISWYREQFTVPPVIAGQVGIVQLTDQYSHSGELKFTEKVTLVNLFFTRCPVVCPKIMNNLKNVQHIIGNDINIYSLSIDPVNDTVGRLQDYAKRSNINNNWYLFTGSKKDIYRFARKELMMLATDGDGGETDFIHSDNIVLVDQNGNIRGYYKGTDAAQTKQLVRDIKKII